MVLVTDTSARTRVAWQAVAGTTARWRWTVAGVAFLALLVRVLIIAGSHGGSDLRNYTYFSRLALHGHDPFTPPQHGLFAPIFANSPPLEFALFSLLLRVHDSPTTLRILFALADVALILLVGFASRSPRPWRAAFITFYAFDPLVLVSWTVYAEDKTLLFLAITILIFALEQGRVFTSWLAAAFLAAFKFLGAYFVPVLVVYTLRKRRTQAILLLALFLVLFAASNLPWFPESVKSFTRRDQRLNIDPPIHASPTLLLSRIGLYARLEPRLLTAFALLVVLFLFVLRRIAVRDAIALSLFSGYIFLPDDSFDRLLLISLPFLLLVRPTRVQWSVLWAITTVAAFAAVVETRGVPHALAPIGALLRGLFSHEATVRDVLWMNAPVVAILVTYAVQRKRQAWTGPERVQDDHLQANGPCKRP